MPQYLIPGFGYISETRSGQFLVPGIGYISETAASATAITWTGPTSGATGVASSAFTVGLNGTPSSPVTVNLSDGGGGGTFTPSSLTLTAGMPTGTVTYTPSAVSEVTRTLSVTNDSGLANPANISFLVIVTPVGAITSTVINGQTVTISGTTGNTPVSGLATITGSAGGVTQGPTAVTLGSGTFTITFTNVAPGTYSPTVTLTNSAGTGTATGGSSFEILGVGEGATTQRAVIHKNGGYARVTDAQLGTGLKPLVVYNGKLRYRQTTEGVPIVLVPGVNQTKFRLLQPGETLEI